MTFCFPFFKGVSIRLGLPGGSGGRKWTKARRGMGSRERGGDAGETNISPFLEVNLGEDKGPEREGKSLGTGQTDERERGLGRYKRGIYSRCIVRNSRSL